MPKSGAAQIYTLGDAAAGTETARGRAVGGALPAQHFRHGLASAIEPRSSAAIRAGGWGVRMAGAADDCDARAHLLLRMRGLEPG